MRTRRIGVIPILALGLLLGGLAVPISAHADPGPTVTVSPSTGVVPGQVLTVNLSNFTPGDQVCVNTASGPTPGPTCYYTFDLPVIAADGTLQTTVSYPAGCPTGPCYVAVDIQPTDGTDDTVAAISGPITFVDSSTVTPDEQTSGLVPGQSFTGTVSGFSPNEGLQVWQRCSMGAGPGWGSTDRHGNGTFQIDLVPSEDRFPTVPCVTDAVDVAGDVPGVGYVRHSIPIVVDGVPPGPVQSLTATATSHTVSVSWVAPSNAQAVSAYAVILSRADNPLQQIISPPSTSATFSGLNPATHYSVSVRALLSGNYVGGPSSAVSTRTLTANQQVTAVASATTVVAGHQLVVSGVVRPRHHAKIAVEQWRGGRWRVTSLRVVNSRYKVRIRPTLTTTGIRIVALGTNGYRPAVSKVLTIHVRKPHRG